MNITIDEVRYGFRVKRIRLLDEIDGTLYEMVYEKTGTELCFLERKDENKCFCIAFKTIPEDSTGVFHILEHSVLCGSEKYPVRDPFVELLKSSVNTFLNAMTYPDKTIYPVASRNDIDFMNLMDIYLDAVLHPNIYHRPEIFRQEGWRYQPEEEGDFSFQGVVLNEMKGAYASAETVMEYAMNRNMLSETPYSFESGGLPENITDLSYEQFIAMHRKYYHPSNARIMLVGDVKIDEALQKIDSFLRDYDRLDEDFSIPYQESPRIDETVVPYEIGEDESTAKKTMVSRGYYLGTFEDQEKSYAATILSDYLAGDNDSPLRAAILKENLATDFTINVHDGIQQTWVDWEALCTEPDRIPRIEEVVQTTLEKILNEGLDKKRLTACYNYFAFIARDKENMPRSLTDAIMMLDSWLYGGDPALYLLCEDVLASLEKKINEGYYEKLLKELFTENKKTSRVVLVPSAELGKKKVKEEEERLKKRLESMDPPEIGKLYQEADALEKWQTEPESEEALAAIPHLKLSDINSKAEDVSPEVSEVDGIPLLRHKNGSPIVMMNLRFNACDLTEEELPMLALMDDLLGKLRTKKHSSEELQLLKKMHIGAMAIGCEGVVTRSHEQKMHLLCTSLFLKKEQQEAAELLHEILTETDFTDIRAARNIIMQMNTDLAMGFASSGHQYGISRVGASLSSLAAVNEHLSGGTYVKWIRKVSGMDDEALLEILRKMEDLARKLFIKSRMVISVSEAADPSLPEKTAALFDRGEPPKRGSMECSLFPEEQVGIAIPAQIGYAVRGTHIDRQFTGAFYALQNILNFSYLWNEIRVLNGAYGCGFIPRDHGDLYFYSYRDPKPENSLEVYKKAADYVRAFLEEDPDLTTVIIGALGAVDPLLNPRNRMSLGDLRWLKGVTYEEALRVRKTLLECTKEDLLELLPYLEKLGEEAHIAVVAGKNLLENCGDVLTSSDQII